ncbi:pimeloyl-[acyl-carrier protein] methyl ester esterase [Sulfuriferula plumbiphila]|uniref:Pimeloyl-[acyl-carrier protein] methyl ester esterase n=1 Tax=Sulfuriferula plumbiphila TaxID=171865 RepID=A0A512L717_9PROT|nr:pimeloyl-ACP methyl ester esterase BioH [Sulfuriferula plumbiphila]BBP02853.1 pimeloyl-[acyl-carrier protein] methyl ester esterase [Sulfuriferula plumbiphila]GEP30280.1 pimeloyl-[acyl-carrier protein] methyl ester esterase [Sulfuriferula plumbiphila]
MAELHIEIRGQGMPLVLLHGWGMHGGVWAGVADELARHDQLHIVDLPGYGGSATLAPYALETLAARLIDALPHYFNVCGWSLGGQVALTLAKLYPARVNRLVTVGTNPCFATRADWPQGIQREVLQIFADSLVNDYEGTLKRFLALQARGDESARAVLARLRDLLFARGRPDQAVLEAGLAILLNADLRASVTGIPHPALVIHGSHDALAPLAAGEWLAQHLPDGHLCRVSGASHAPFLSHSAGFVLALTDFLHD